jgi:hypothetical protein
VTTGYAFLELLAADIQERQKLTTAFVEFLFIQELKFLSIVTAGSVMDRKVTYGTVFLHVATYNENGYNVNITRRNAL